MNTAKRARLAAVPLDQLDLATQRGQREYRRRLRRKAGELGNAWLQQTRKPVNHPPALKNAIGRRQRWRWVAKA